MRKRNLLVATVIASMIGGATLAVGQGAGSGGTSSGGAGGAAAPSGAERSSPGTGSMGGTSAKPNAEQRSEKGSNAASSGRSENNKAAGQNNSADQSDRNTSAQSKGQNAPSKDSDSRSGASSSSGATAKGGSASLSSEQRTKIHQTIVRQGNAPRVANVNFSVSVGTTVPRSVQLAAVPAAIIEIQPAWRGYEYFMVGERVVIVDPDTMQIIAIIVA